MQAENLTPSYSKSRHEKKRNERASERKVVKNWNEIESFSLGIVHKLSMPIG